MNLAFRAYFARHIGAISAVLRAIPGIDTGHDGCDLWLHSHNGLWVVSAQPELNMGHNGVWRISMAHKQDAGWGPWSTFSAYFNARGELEYRSESSPQAVRRPQ